MPQAFFRHLGIWGCLLIFKAVKHCSEARHVCFGARSWLWASLAGFFSESSNVRVLMFILLCWLHSPGKIFWTAACWHLEGIRVRPGSSRTESRSQLPALLEVIGTAGSLHPGHELLLNGLGMSFHLVALVSLWSLPWLTAIYDSLYSLCCHIQWPHFSLMEEQHLCGFEEDIWNLNGFRSKEGLSTLSPFNINTLMYALFKLICWLSSLLIFNSMPTDSQVFPTHSLAFQLLE